jgi:DNA polymerase III delta' subunit
MINALTRGQDRAVAEAGSMIRGHAPHAVLLVGPGSVGKTTLAMDIAAGLLCTAADPAARPCRECRGCRQVASGNHPDLHRLSPEGPGGQVRIGAQKDPDPGTVRHLIGAVALLPVEGGARVAIVEQAHRLNDDAQNALLKLLEEPPSGVTLILCADDEECLLPTVRSRCVRLRLGAVPIRQIESWLCDQGLVDAPEAARLARLAAGRPGLALAYARSSTAERLRGEIARGLLDMLGSSRQKRLAAIRDLLRTSIALETALASGRAPESTTDAAPRVKASRTKKRAGAEATSSPETLDEPEETETPDTAGAAEPGKVSAADRRAAAATLMEIWADVGRDLVVAGSGAARQLREVELLDDIRTIGPKVSRASMGAFLGRLSEVDAKLDENVNPELALDVLALAWPRVEAVEPAAKR